MVQPKSKKAKKKPTARKAVPKKAARKKAPSKKIVAKKVAPKKKAGAKGRAVIPGNGPDNGIVLGSQYLNKLIESLEEAVIILDAGFRAISTNSAYLEITGETLSEAIGRVPSFYRVITENDFLRSAMRQNIEDYGHWEGELWAQRKDGGEYAQRLSVSAVPSESGGIFQYVIVISDLGKKVRENEELLYQASYDALTGIPNRSLFQDRLSQSVSVMARSGKKLSLMFIDLDGFKLINDTLGHEAGDKLLIEAAERLGHCIRSGDTVARLGGDEFTIIMPNIKDPRDSTLVAERVLKNLAAPFDLGGHEAFVSGSIGVTIFPDDADNATDLLKNADAAMYRAKDLGKANYQFFTSDLNEEAREKLNIKNGLAKAVDRNELSLCFQPKQRIECARITGVEALLRWESEELGYVSPDRFISALDESAFAIEVGEWIVRSACEQARAWCESQTDEFRVAVNLSSRQLRDPRMIQGIKTILADTKMEAKNLEIEIQESMLTVDAKRVGKSLDALSKMGVRITIDDFGVGYSSLTLLSKFPIDTLKINRSFISNITVNSGDADVTRAIITLGKTLGLSVVAVGVETEEQLSLLHAYGCDETQGYFISPPVPGEEILDILKSKTESRAIRSF